MRLSATQVDVLRMLARPNVVLWRSGSGDRLSNGERVKRTTSEGLADRGLIYCVAVEGPELESWAITEIGRVVLAGAEAGRKARA